MIVRNADTMPGTYVWYVAAVLTLANSFAFVDRQVLALLMQPIKADLHISLLYGLCLSLLQVLIEVEMVRLAGAAGTLAVCIAVALRRHSVSLTRLEAAEWLEIGHG